jgi:branched-chain amino acid transport system ATP-binding protein
VDVAYGDLLALRGVSLTVEAGEILCVVGANGAGKSTMLQAISGLRRPRAGEILLDGTRLDRDPSHVIVARGVVQVAEGRKIFPALSVLENLELGAYTPPARARRRESLDSVFALFPKLRENARQLNQMPAIRVQPLGTYSGLVAPPCSGKRMTTRAWPFALTLTLAVLLTPSISAVTP